jgi:DNA-binding protein HU-beta
MNSTDLAEKVAQATGIPKTAASGAVEAVVQGIIDAAKAGDEVRVAGLGIFDVVTRDARPGRNPQTGESITIAASRALRFRAGKAAKDQLNANGKVAPQKAGISGHQSWNPPGSVAMDGRR